MKRFFASDAESDMLIAEATKTFGLKIGDMQEQRKFLIIGQTVIDKPCGSPRRAELLL